MPQWLQAGGWGLLAGSALLVGAAVGYLARVPQKIIASVMAFGAAGDVLLELMFMAGVAAFAAGHVTAICLYLANRRPGLGLRDCAVPALLMLVGAAMPFVLLAGSDGMLPFLIYSLLLSAMAATAWLSRFPRPLTGVGALLFVASDALIALRMSQPQLELGAAIWLLYYAGQLLVFTGVSLSPPRR